MLTKRSAIANPALFVYYQSNTNLINYCNAKANLGDTFSYLFIALFLIIGISLPREI